MVVSNWNIVESGVKHHKPNLIHIIPLPLENQTSYLIFSFMCMLYRSLFVLLSFFFSPLFCLLFFDIRILITPLVTSNSSLWQQFNKFLKEVLILYSVFNLIARFHAREIKLIDYFLTVLENMRFVYLQLFVGVFMSYLRYLCLFGSSVPPVVCRRTHVLSLLFGFVCL